MIFADTLVEAQPDARSLLRGSRVLRVHKDVFDMASELVANDRGQIAKIAKFICWPDHDTWIDVETGSGRHFGFLYQAEKESVTHGRGMLVIDDKAGAPPMWLPVQYDLPSFSMRWFDPRADARLRLAENPQARMLLDHRMRQDIETGGDPIAQAAQVTPVLNAFKPLLFALLALINSPKLIRTREIDVSKINKQRLKKGHYPFHPHHEIRINVDRHDGKVTKGLAGPEREQFFVRAHPRFLVHPRYKNVSVVMIPPHYRGNPELGMRNTDYVVDRNGSRWRK